MIIILLKKLEKDGTEYDRQLIAYAMLDLAIAYQEDFLGILFEPFYQNFISEEL